MKTAFYPIFTLLVAPLLPGIINRTKAFFAGRRGPPLLQMYYDLWKLLRKESVYSRTTTWVFLAGPLIALAAALVLPLMTPMGNLPALCAFPGDILLWIYILGLWRFFTVLAALDTGSSFEGMGASREMFFGFFAELPFVLGIVALAYYRGDFMLSHLFSRQVAVPVEWALHLPLLLLIGSAWFVVALAENARIPVDDPNTHLELTMIHEVLILDHGGPELAGLLYAANIKLWLYLSLLVNLFFPIYSSHLLYNGLVFAGGMLLVTMLVGVVESAWARLRLPRVPQLLLGATALAFVALLLAIGP